MSQINSNFIGRPVKEIKKKYRLTDIVLGTGAFSTVKKAVNNNGIEFACKIISKEKVSDTDLDDIHREVQILQTLDHPNVIKCYDVYEDHKQLYIFTIFASGGELFERIVQKSKYEEQDAKDVVKRIAYALRFCHKRGIIHRDLKPDNILLLNQNDDSQIIIADFGFATTVNPALSDHKTLQTQLGTPNYIAPEIIDGQVYNYKCDIWSFGVITYALLSGHLPFGGRNKEQLFENIKIGKFFFLPEEAWENVSDDAKDFIQHLICVDPDQRYNYDQIVEHEWLASETERHSDLTMNLKSLENFNEKKRKLQGGLKALEAALIMEEMMFGF